MKLVKSTYNKEDCIFLLKDLSNYSLELPTSVREKQMQSKGHYSESLPEERPVDNEYKKVYKELLNETKMQLASYIKLLAHKIINDHDNPFVLVSLARGGTPIGALLARYCRTILKKEVPHYSISIIRGRGLDLEAVHYIKQKYPTSAIQFIDGWTGKGAITKELEVSCKRYEQIYQTSLPCHLAVIADPGNCATICATQEDFLVVNSLLNSTISGLISRTVLNSSFISDGEFHGAKFYEQFMNEDETNHFLDEVEACFTPLEEEVVIEKTTITFTGWDQVEQIAKEFNIDDLNLIKPSLGEATRVLLRRKPWKLLIKDLHHPKVKHLLLLAKEKEVEIVHYPSMNYLACGIIKKIKS